MNIFGKTMIFKSDYGYSTAISNKNKDGEYEKMYISVQLPRQAELENKTIINITNGFLSFYKSKDGLPKLKIVIMDYEVDEEQKYIQEEREAIQNENSYNLSDDELPF